MLRKPNAQTHVGSRARATTQARGGAWRRPFSHRNFASFSVRPRPRFGPLFGAPGRPKIIKNRLLDLLCKETVLRTRFSSKNVHFSSPRHSENHGFIAMKPLISRFQHFLVSTRRGTDFASFLYRFGTQNGSQTFKKRPSKNSKILTRFFIQFCSFFLPLGSPFWHPKSSKIDQNHPLGPPKPSNGI